MADKRTILVFGEHTFRIHVPENSRLTFGPFSPGEKGGGYGERGNRGTLRVYKGPNQIDCIGVFTGVTGYREETLEYEEQVAKEEGAILWKSDQHGYSREEKVQREENWESRPAITSSTKKRRKE